MANNTFSGKQSLVNTRGSAIYDASGRLRVSQLNTLIDIKQFNDEEPLFYDRENIGGALQTYVKNKGGVEMSVSFDGDAAISQSKMFAPYFSGKSQLIELTFANFQNQSGVIKRVGYFSSNTTTPFDSNKDGIWIEADGIYHRFIIQKNGSEIVNDIIDDERLDFSNFNVLFVDFLYLGGTSITYGFFINGQFEVIGKYNHAGNNISTFVESPDEPIRYEIRSTGGIGSMDQICAQVSSEGSIGEIGVSRGIWNQDFQANTASTYYASLGVRLKSDYRNIRVDKEDIAILSEGNQEYQWFLCLNPTIVNINPGNWTDLNSSSVQYYRGDTANTIANESNLGTVLETGFGVGNASVQKAFRNSIRIGSNINGSLDELWIVVFPLGNGLDAWCELTINEFI